MHEMRLRKKKLDYYTPQDVADLLGLHRVHVYRLLKAGSIRGVRTGIHGPWRVTPAELKRLQKHGWPGLIPPEQQKQRGRPSKAPKPQAQPEPEAEQ